MKTLTVVIIFTSTFVALGGELADYHFTYATNKLGDLKVSRSHDAVVSTNHGITEIGIERAVCFGLCPAYTFIAKSDGSFRYKGDKYVERTGEFTGTISVEQFHQLAQFIRDSGYSELEDAYDQSTTDCSTVYSSVVMRGKRKVVRNYASAGPTKLWAIERLIDDLMREVKWNSSRKADTKK
jgi:hypothetical protein